MEHQQESSTRSTFVLEVKHVKSCAKCQEKSTKALKNFRGVDSVSFDAEGQLKVSGNIDAKIIVGKFSEWGKKAELLSFRKGPVFEMPRGVRNCSKKCTSEPASNSSDDDSDQVNKPMKNNAQVSKENSQFPAKEQSTKKNTKFFSFLRGLFPKKNAAKKKGPNPTMKGPLKWCLPQPYMHETPYGPYPPVHGSGVAPPYYHNSHMHPGQPPPPRPPTAHPYVMFTYRPPLKVDPMIQYNSYADMIQYNSYADNNYRHRHW